MPHGRQRRESEEPQTAIVGVPTAAARCIGPESLPTYIFAPRISSASWGIERLNRITLSSIRLATSPANDSSPGPDVTTIVRPRAARPLATAPKRAGSQRLVDMTEPG